MNKLDVAMIPNHVAECLWWSPTTALLSVGLTLQWHGICC